MYYARQDLVVNYWIALKLPNHVENKRQTSFSAKASPIGRAPFL